MLLLLHVHREMWVQWHAHAHAHAHATATAGMHHVKRDRMPVSRRTRLWLLLLLPVSQGTARLLLLLLLVNQWMLLLLPVSQWTARLLLLLLPMHLMRVHALLLRLLLLLLRCQVMGVGHVRVLPGHHHVTAVRVQVLLPSRVSTLTRSRVHHGPRSGSWIHHGSGSGSWVHDGSGSGTRVHVAPAVGRGRERGMWLQFFATRCRPRRRAGAGEVRPPPRA